VEKAEQLVIVGDGEFARIALEYFSCGSGYQVCGFCVEREFMTRAELNNLPVTTVEEIEQTYPASEYTLFVAVTHTQLNRTRTRLFNRLRSCGYRFASYRHPSAFVAASVHVGQNVFIYDSCSIQPFVNIGDNVICGSGSRLSHRVKIADNAYLASGVVIGGFTSVGKNCFLGLNCTVGDQLEICPDVVVAAGAVLVENTRKPHVYRGNPALDTGLASLDLFRLRGGTL